MREKYIIITAHSARAIRYAQLIFAQEDNNCIQWENVFLLPIEYWESTVSE